MIHIVQKLKHFSPLQNLLSKCGLQQEHLDGEYDLVSPWGGINFQRIKLEIFSSDLPACLTDHESWVGTNSCFTRQLGWA